MIDHIGLTVANFAVSRKFYLAALAPLGYAIRKEHPDAAGFGAGDPNDGGDPGGDFWLAQGEPATPRLHVAFRAQSVEQVQAFYQAALAAGARDNGAPGLRPEYHADYYGAFVYDPDGYNIEAVFHGGIAR